LAKNEAVLTDSVYSAKALHAVVDRAAKVDGPIVFWHTGGIPALFSDTAGVTAWRQTDPASTPFHSRHKEHS
jgi:1-aminocyclopropane-1-carboxylate deaminase/D-cysteine desulfhydrase-like pyridoxal-dependent ACC family enzyme